MNICEVLIQVVCYLVCGATISFGMFLLDVDRKTCRLCGLFWLPLVAMAIVVFPIGILVSGGDIGRIASAISSLFDDQ